MFLTAYCALKRLAAGYSLYIHVFFTSGFGSGLAVVVITRDREVLASILKNIALIYQAGKVRLGFLIMACTLAGIAVSPTSSLSALEIFALAVYVLVASSTSGAFNQWYERDIDAVMDRTKDRPFVTKELEPTNTWNFWLVIISILALYATYQVSNLDC